MSDTKKIVIGCALCLPLFIYICFQVFLDLKSFLIALSIVAALTGIGFILSTQERSRFDL